MGIFKRVRDISVAAVHEVLDHLEDPVAMLNQYLRDMEAEISKAEMTISRETVTASKWKSSIDEMKQRIEKRERQAQLAIDNGNEYIAKQAIHDKQQSEEKLEKYQILYDHSTEQIMLVQNQLNDLKEKYQEYKHKKQALISRANVASSVKEINKVMLTIDSDTAAKGFARIEEKLMQMEADSNAFKRIRRTYDSVNIDPARIQKVEEEFLKIKESRQSTETNEEANIANQ